MKIDAGTPKKTKTREMVFSDLENGDLFQIEDGTLFIRIGALLSDYDEYNAVRLENGEATYFYDDTEVAKYVEYIKLTPQAFVNEVPIN